MYNVKFFKYPSGWQVRVYNTLVGFHEKPDNFLVNDEYMSAPVWDEDIQEYIYTMLPCETWVNPFTMKTEPVPVAYEDIKEDLEEKKKRSVRSSMGRTVNAVYRIARANVWDWFITFTFNPDIVDSFDYSATVKKLSMWLNNMRKASPDLGYIVVPEQHESGRYHFHGLFKDCEGFEFVPSSKCTNKGEVIYNVGKYKFGWTTATRIGSQDRVTKYIAKYINKDLCQVAFGKRRYWVSRNLNAADVQEVVLDKDKLNQLVSRLEKKASFIKQVECAEVVTTYFELPAGLDEEEM